MRETIYIQLARLLDLFMNVSGVCLDSCVSKCKRCCKVCSFSGDVENG